MANSGKIYITITDDRTGGKNGDGTSESTPSKNESKESSMDLLKDFTKHRFFTFLKDTSKQIVNYSITNIGNFSGDFQQQREIQNLVSIGTTLYGIGTAFATGGIVGGTIAMAGSVISYGLQEYSGQVAVNQQNRTTEQLKRLSGLSGLTNGSR